ncbi:tellurium resistance protein TerC [candidate division LCP-89 bacterium B3_LCP]|uniref:Tellurium resistance protein TerC n=1 Tax=candidate division LCP-89 bacterium B3_LCP TaxID=2012998 RepID=A0A532UZV1_UNCL8|nr:MAG: tellurium resistance protein TerC [candidate division LCP-89 bacterium B3_LCP]
MSRKSSLLWVLFWISTALAFNAGVWYFYGQQKALEFFTGYLIEYSLSVDNLFVFIMIFSYFGVDDKQQHKALNWGIAGAIVFRMIFILFGITLIHYFHQIIYIFGVLLLWSAYTMAFSKNKDIQPDKIPLVRWCRKIIPVTKDYHGDRFFTRSAAGLCATPLLIVVLVVESSDIMFAIDSIPAILSITQDPFIVISSNIFAILGLRSLYFALAGVMRLFRFLKQGVAVILAFVGVKMLLMDIFHVPTFTSLLVIVSLLTISVLSSVIWKQNAIGSK